MIRTFREDRVHRAAVLRFALLGALALVLVVPTAGYGGQAKKAAPQASQACQLQVFSWWTGGGEAAGLAKLINIWNKNNASCKFKNETVAGGAGTNAKAVLAQRLAAHKPPDSFQGHAGAELRDYIKAGQVEPIDRIYKQYHFDKVMPKTLLNQIKYNGHLYSVPVNIHRANVLWYNPGVLKKAGITKVPTTWTEFIAALEKAKSADVIPLALGQAWTQKHLLETVMLATLGPTRWAALWKKGGNWSSAGVTLALNRFKAADLHELRRREPRVAGRREARGGRQGRLQHHGRLAGRLLQRHQGWGQPRPQAERRLRLGRSPGHGRRLRLAVRQLYAAQGRTAPRRCDPVAGVPRQQEGAGHVQPGEGLDPGPPGREREAVRALPQVGAQAVEDRQAGGLADAWRRGEQCLEHRHRHGPRAVRAEQGRSEVPERSRRRREEARVRNNE